MATEAADAVARLHGEPLTELPEDLYIPPEALRVFLETFEGPLDLLLYLIRRQNVDVVNIPVVEITRQYMAYMELMQTLQLELAAEYLVMAATLAEIKSRLLLPRPPAAEDEEAEDPRAELVRRLQEYERVRRAAECLDERPRMGRELWPAAVAVPEAPRPDLGPEASLPALLSALAGLLARADVQQSHTVATESVSVRARMSDILSRVVAGGRHPFSTLFDLSEGRLGVVATFLALLELLKEGLVEIEQTDPLAELHVRAAA